MADDIIVRFKVEDGGVLAHIKELNTLQKNLNATQKKVTKTTKSNADAQKDLAQKQILANKQFTQYLRAVRSAGTSLKKLGINLRTVEQALDGNSVALGQIKKALNLANISVKKSTRSINKNSTAHKKSQKEIKKTGSGLFDIHTKNRLVEGSFATMRSKLLLVSFAFGLVTAAVTRNIQAFATQQESVARLAMTFGRAASVELQEYASALQKVTRFGDESINSVMAQFGAYGANTEQTRALTKATLDLAEGQGMDLNSAALLVSKSFGTSTNALSRYGIELSSSMTQQEKINAIVTQSEKRYGGLSEMLGKLSGSSTKQLSMAFGDLQERLGEALADGLLPLIEGMTSLVEALDTRHLRVMIRSVVGLTIALGLLKGGTALLGVIRAFKAARTIAAIYNTQLILLTGSTVGLTTATRVFFKSLVVNTGGLYALVIGVGFAITSLLSLFGAFGKNNEEEEEMNKLLDESNDKFKALNTGPAVAGLDNFYEKLLEGNDLLRLYNQSMKIELVDAINSLRGIIPEGMSKQLTKDRASLVDLRAELKKLEAMEEIQILHMLPEVSEESLNIWRQGIIHETNILDPVKIEVELGEVTEVDFAGTLKSILSGVSKVEPLEPIIEPAKIFNRQELIAEIAKVEGLISNLDTSILNQVGSIDNWAGAWKDNFKEATGASEGFFNKYIEGSKLQDAIDTDKIKTNEQLTAVIQGAVDKGSALNAKEIEEILTETELISIKKQLTEASENHTRVLGETIALGLGDLGVQRQKILADIEEAKTIKDKTQAILDGIEARKAALVDIDAQIANNTRNEELSFIVLTEVAQKKMKIWSQLASGFASLNQASKGSALVTGRLQQIAATIDAIVSASSAAAEAPLGMKVAAAAAHYAMGMARVIQIEQQLSKMGGASTSGPVAEAGGYIAGNRHSQGGTMIEAERGEFIMSRRAVNSIGLEAINNMNVTGNAGSSVTVNVSGNVLTQDFVEGELAESIKEAVRRGSDFGLS